MSDPLHVEDAPLESEGDGEFVDIEEPGEEVQP
jgi:hypothetical protein